MKRIGLGLLVLVAMVVAAAFLFQKQIGQFVFQRAVQ